MVNNNQNKNYSHKEELDEKSRICGFLRLKERYRFYILSYDQIIFKTIQKIQQQY